jgi:U3 small nucleolar RNA-associated protein 5
MGRKSSSAAVPKVSSASAPAASSVTASTQKSSVLKSAFAPSQFQLHLFASVVQSFDSNQLRIHDTTTGRLRCQHESRPGSRITCLDWGYYGGPYQEQRQTPSKKKRKRDQDSSEGAVVAYGTSSSEICLFSPAEGKIIGTLAGPHDRGIRDFKFSPAEYKEGWSIGEDGKLVQWDLTTSQTTRFVLMRIVPKEPKLTGLV